MDVEVAHTLKNNLTLAAGVRNLLDTYPTENPHSGQTGAKYPESSPYGFNGGFYYVSANYTF